MKLELDSNNMLKGGILDLSGMTFRKIVEYFEIGDVDDLLGGDFYDYIRF